MMRLLLLEPVHSKMKMKQMIIKSGKSCSLNLNKSRLSINVKNRKARNHQRKTTNQREKARERRKKFLMMKPSLMWWTTYGKSMMLTAMAL
jgi:hypothetical protein